jgi:hypothetical protein
MIMHYELIDAVIKRTGKVDIVARLDDIRYRIVVVYNNSDKICFLHSIGSHPSYKLEIINSLIFAKMVEHDYYVKRCAINSISAIMAKLISLFT